MKHKSILLATCLLTSCSSAAEPGYLVFGDSQSIAAISNATASDIWPHLVQHATGLPMQNLSIAGRELASGDVATYLRSTDTRPNTEIKGIIIAMGGNDGWHGIDPSTALQDAITEATSRELEVICILPPPNGWYDTTAIGDLIASYCPDSIDAGDWVSAEDMPDGAHFGKDGHYKYAVGVFLELYKREE